MQCSLATVALRIDVKPMCQKQVQQLSEPGHSGLRRAPCASGGQERGGEGEGIRGRKVGGPPTVGCGVHPAQRDTRREGGGDWGPRSMMGSEGSKGLRGVGYRAA